MMEWCRWRLNRLRCMTPMEVSHRLLRTLSMRAERAGLLGSGVVPPPDLALEPRPWVHATVAVDAARYLAAADRVACARSMEALGVDFIVHHVGYDERRMITGLSPMDEIDAVVRAVSIPVQAVGGLSIRQAIDCPSRGAPLVVLGAPLVIDADAFTPVTGTRLREVLSEICREIRQSNYPITR